MEKVREFGKELINFGISKKVKYTIFAGAITFALSKLYSDYKSDIILLYKKTEKNKKAIENCPTIKNGKYYPTCYLPHPFPQIMY